MYEFTEEEINFNLEDPEEIEIANNALKYGNTIYQISNISQITVRKWKRVKKDLMPTFALLTWLFLGALILMGAIDARARLLGILMIVVGLFAYLSGRIERVKYMYVLMIELNSQTRRFFPSTSENFLKEVALKLQYVIENPHAYASFTANFVTQQFEFSVDHSFYDNSVIINGDLTQGFINTGTANGTLNSW